MNDLEGRVRSALEAEAATVRPRPDALEENRRRLRRAGRRRRAAIPAVAALSAATVTAGVFVVVEHESPSGPSGLAEPRRVKDITQLASLSAVVTIGGRVPGGADFQVEALGTDGSVLGRSPDKKVWEADGAHPRPKSLGLRADGGLATGPGFRTWMTLGGNSDDLRCRSVPDGRVKVISLQGMWPRWGMWASGRILAWNDAMRQPSATRACDRGHSLRLPNSGVGDVVALDGTSAFAMDHMNNRNLREIDVSTGRVRAVHTLPAGVVDVTPRRRSAGPDAYYVDPPKNWDAIHPQYAAATQDVFAWVVGGRLWVTDRRTWRHAITLPVRPPAPAPLPAPPPVPMAVMTAGDHVVVYTAKTATQGWKSVLYNTRTGSTITIPGQAYAAGDYLLWRQGADYRLAQVG